MKKLTAQWNLKTGSDEMTRESRDAEAISIRSATAADCEGILACLHAAFEPFQCQYTPGAYSDTVLNLHTLQERLQEMAVLVAVTDSDEIIGTIACKALKNGEGHLRGMAVLPGWQGRELAQQLLDRAESHLRESGCNRITLDTTEPLRRAIRFYKRNGFLATGRTLDFFGMPLFEYEKQL
jgi:ribosomal protein S18 acetylase RimI-like enzyme